MPDLAKLTIRPDGVPASTPPIDGAQYSDYSITLEGAFDFTEVGGQSFDAVYRFREDGTILGKHNFLSWMPRQPILQTEDVAGHRYVFRVPQNWDMNGQSLEVGLDFREFTRQFFVTDSEILRSLSGGIQVTVHAEPIGAALPAWMVPALGIPAAGLLAGTAWVIRRRMLFGKLDADLTHGLQALQSKAAAALKIAACQKRTSRELRARIGALVNGAGDITKRLQTIRRSLGMTDSNRTESEIATLEARLVSVKEASTRLELESALDQKRKALLAANDLRSAEERCQLRLAKIEGVIDSVSLQLQRANVGDNPGPVEDTVLRELESEVGAVGEVARDAEEQAYLRVR